MILNANPKQITLQDDGQILWQADPTNPLPGVPVARIVKGEDILKPGVELLALEGVEGANRDAVRDTLVAWLHAHVATVLDALDAVVRGDLPEGAVGDIARAVHAGMGIVPRAELETHIAALDPEMRKTLRQRHVRLGPLLVFVPELNKPAAVRLRALLWWLWHDRPLPAPVPRDGAVSVVVDEAGADPVYYRAISYPLYGARAIRIDMLDRLVSAVYDGAKNGVFRAEHKMAEWMGCPIPDLYKILEAMGHTKIDEPAPAPAPAEESKAEEEKPETVQTEDAQAEPAKAEAVKQDPVKPELASFRLKRNRPAAAPGARKPFPPREGGKKPDRPNKPHDAAKKRGRPDGRKDGRKQDRDRDEGRVFEARPKQVADSPFAILQQMKAGMKDQ